MHEPPEQAGRRERSRWAQGSQSRWPRHSTSPTVKRSTDESVQVDAARDDVPPCLLGCHAQLVESLGLDEREVVAARVHVREGADAVEVPIALEAAAGDRRRLVDEHDRLLGVGGHGERLDPPARSR